MNKPRISSELISGLIHTAFGSSPTRVAPALLVLLAVHVSHGAAVASAAGLFRLMDAKHGRSLVSGTHYDGAVYHQPDAGRATGQWKFVDPQTGVAASAMPEIGKFYLIIDAYHGRALVAGDGYDGAVYHQDPRNRTNAMWKLVATGGGKFFIVDKKHGKALIAGDAYDGRLYHQDPRHRENAKWALENVTPGSVAPSGPQRIQDAKHGRSIVAGERYDGAVHHRYGALANAQWEFQDTGGGWYRIVDKLHRKALVAGDSYDGRLYHQDPRGRANAMWKLVATGGGKFFIVDKKHGKALIAGDAYDGRLYHQDPRDRENAKWSLAPLPRVVRIDPAPPSKVLWTITDVKHKRSIVAGDESDGHVYHQEHRSRANAQWEIVDTETGTPVSVRPNAGKTYFIFDRSHDRALVAGDRYDGAIYHQFPYGRDNSMWSFEDTGGGKYRIIDKKHKKALIAGDAYDGNLYHRDPGFRENAKWELVREDVGSLWLVNQSLPGSLVARGGTIAHRPQTRSLEGQWRLRRESDGYYVITGVRDNRALVAGDKYDGRVYYQDAQHRPNARWGFLDAGSGNFFVVDRKHGNALAAEQDGRISHRPHGNRPNAKWRVVTKPPDHPELDPKELFELAKKHRPEWRFDRDEDYWPVDIQAHLESAEQRGWVRRVCTPEGRHRFIYSSDDLKKGGPLDQAMTYAFVERSRWGYNVTYYLYYPWNDANPVLKDWDHWGDWERATVRLFAAPTGLEPMELTTEAHGNTWTNYWDSGEVWKVSNGSAPVVMVAEDSHGTYPNTMHERGAFDHPDKDSQNRTCVDGHLSAFCDFVGSDGRRTRLDVQVVKVMSDYRLNEPPVFEGITENGDTKEVAWLSRDEGTCDFSTKFQTLLGPVWRWGFFREGWQFGEKAWISLPGPDDSLRPSDDVESRWDTDHFDLWLRRADDADGPTGPVDKGIFGSRPH